MATLDHFDIVVMGDEVISTMGRQWFELLYQPIIGLEATALYSLLQNLISNSELESNRISYFNFISRLGLKNENDFLKAKDHLEAIGLLDSYQQENLVIFLVKSPLKPTAFFDNINLSSLLENTIGKSEFINLKNQYLVRRYDLNDFKKISKRFDEVYEIDYYDYDNEYDKWWDAIKKNYPKLSKAHFDYDTLIAMIEPTGLLSSEVLKSSEFFYLINSVSFQFGLSVDEIAQAIRQSANINRTFDKELFIKAVRRIYDDKLNGKKVVIKTPLREDEKNERVKLLDEISHNVLISSRFHKTLLSSEIAMFDILQNKHGFSNGFINVLIIYVLENQNGVIPSLNYFLKVANTWYRQGITTTAQALDFVENMDKVKKPVKPYKQTKKNVKEPEWLEDHLKETKEKINQVEKEDVNIEDLKNFFDNLD